MNERYDYRYSVLMLTFIRLVRRGYLTMDELDGLAEEKIETIKKLADVER